MKLSCTVSIRTTWLPLAAMCMALQSAGGEDRFADMDQYIQEAMQKWQVPGVAIAVVKDGEIVLARGYGVCELGGERPVTKDTMFSIASCTKSFTAACIGSLVDEGKLGWDDPVRKHLPEFQVADEYVTQHLTLRDLLCHRTGLVRGDLLSVKGEFDRQEILRRTKFLEQAAPLRTKVTYNNVMFAALGEVVARQSGMSWEEFVTQKFIEPLELKSTTISRTKVPTDRLAIRHRRYDDQILPLRKPTHDDDTAPAAAIHSSVVDMATWLSFQLQEGQHSGQRILRAETVREMHALQQSIPIQWRADANIYRARFVGTGLGWFVRDYRGRKVVQHGGGWGADTALVPEENLAIVVLSNQDWNLLVSMLVYDVIDAYLVGPERAWSKDNKWDFWFNVGGPGPMYRTRDEHKAELKKDRVAGTKPSLPLAGYAGRYESKLYGLLEVRHDADRLNVRFGEHAAELAHWQTDMFYGHAVVEPFLDWLVKFRVAGDRSVSELEIINVGWKDPDERHLFRRAP